MPARIQVIGIGAGKRNAMPFMDEILRAAHDAGASDVHLTVGIPPMMRVNGRLFAMDFHKLLPADTLEVLLGLLTETQRNQFEERGEYDMSVSVPGYGRCRVNAYRQSGSVAMAFRLMEDRIPAQEELGIPESARELYLKHRGLVLVTGPAGSGKSVTLASIIDKINQTRDAHIITLEDPIEYIHQHNMSMVNQREVGIDSASFPDALRSALREDPDVILVGELRDYETISMAVMAAETGRLVLSSLHTLDAVSTVDRIINVFPPHQQQQIRVQLAGVLEAVVARQLLPMADGSGRVPAYEVMLANPEIRKLIRENKANQINEVIRMHESSGMITMDDFVRRLYQEGKIDRDTAVRYALDPENMQKEL